MNGFGLVLFVTCAIALLSAPRRWAPLPLLIGCCYITSAQALFLGPFNLPAFRLLLLVGVIRIIVRHERMPGGVTAVDKLMIAWCAWTLFASLFQPSENASGPKYVIGVIFNTAGAYFVLRVLCLKVDDVHQVLKFLCLVLVPIALAMLYERATGYNIFTLLGGAREAPFMRDGSIRAHGPFGHPILAGTVGATCFPFVAAMWSRYRLVAVLGAFACGSIVLASVSSGPIMSLLFGAFAVGMWRYRKHCGRLRAGAVVAYLLLLVIMERPPYFLISRINLTGSSTGWHRSYLIQQTIRHFDEWALIGTNRTRHWMPNQGHISETQTDITNYYISFAVLGGFICMALVIVILWRSFKFVGEYVRHPSTTREEAFFIWCIGAALFSHVATGVSVSYYGQTPVFFWLPVALIASLRAGLVSNKTVPPPPPPSLFAPVSQADRRTPEPSTFPTA